jgi:23S rRNA (cytosine1962-C5)-methyltransferase
VGGGDVDFLYYFLISCVWVFFMSLPIVYLHKGVERRLRDGHPWIFSNEINNEKTVLKSLQPGQQAQVLSHQENCLGTAYFNPNSLICGRFISSEEKVLDEAEILKRLTRALAWREKFFPAPFYRLVHGEADALPGLVIDRFGDFCVVQISTAGMEVIKSAIVAALHSLLKPQGILYRNDVASRELEGLSSEVALAYGEMPQEITLQENNLTFACRPWDGQKTGWFYDQADNRAALSRLVADAQVLDVFAYLGAWGINALAFGAQQVLAVDSSLPALLLASENAKRNGFADRFAYQQGDAFTVLKTLKQAGAQFDVVICDPPAFIKRKKDLENGRLAYRRINQLALSLLKSGGILYTASCSYHLTSEDLLLQVRKAALSNRQAIKILGYGRQRLDHPIHPALPESEYIKALIIAVDESLPTKDQVKSKEEVF